MAFHQVHLLTFMSQSKLAARSFSSCSPRSCLLSLAKRSVQMKSPHPCLGMEKENWMARKRRVEIQATAPSLSHLMVKIQTSSMRLSSGRRTKGEKNCLRRGFKPREIGSRMNPCLNLHSSMSSISRRTGLPQPAARQQINFFIALSDRTNLQIDTPKHFPSSCLICGPQRTAYSRQRSLEFAYASSVSEHSTFSSHANLELWLTDSACLRATFQVYFWNSVSGFCLARARSLGK